MRITHFFCRRAVALSDHLAWWSSCNCGSSVACVACPRYPSQKRTCCVVHVKPYSCVVRIWSKFRVLSCDPNSSSNRTNRTQSILCDDSKEFSIECLMYGVGHSNNGHVVSWILVIIPTNCCLLQVRPRSSKSGIFHHFFARHTDSLFHSNCDISDSVHSAYDCFYNLS